MAQSIESIKSYDTEFQKIQGLAWLPWIGPNYIDGGEDFKILIVGESHYHQDENEANWYRTDETATRAIIENIENSNLKTLSNISRAILGTTVVTPRKLFEKVSYYNFCQRSMKFPAGATPERPIGADFESGWQVFLAVIRVLRPTHCLFVGVSAFYCFESSMKASGLEYSAHWSAEKIGTAYGRLAKISTPPIELIGIQHSGKYFSWKNWHGFIKSNSPDMVDHLRKMVAA
jgi:hypothetical protein